MVIRFLNHDHKIEGLVIILLGILISVWSNTILVVACIQGRPAGSYAERLIIQTCQFTHFIIMAASVVGFHWAIKKNDPDFLKPWLFTKACEGILLFVGTILLENGRDFNWLIAISLIIFILATYVFLGVWNLYTKMSPKEEQINNPTPEPPPSYESFANQRPQLA